MYDWYAWWAEYKEVVLIPLVVGGLLLVLPLGIIYYMQEAERANCVEGPAYDTIRARNFPDFAKENEVISFVPTGNRYGEVIVHYYERCEWK